MIVPERLDAHRLIEEFMILANVAAAETLERRKTPLVYRVHDQPSLEKLEVACAPSWRRSTSRCPRRRCSGRRTSTPSWPRWPGSDIGAAGQRGHPAQPGPGRVRRRELRPFRPQSAPLRPFHLADPPLCRPPRPPRADPGARARRRRPARQHHAGRSWPRPPPRSPPPSGGRWRPSATPSTG